MKPGGLYNINNEDENIEFQQEQDVLKTYEKHCQMYLDAEFSIEKLQAEFNYISEKFPQLVKKELLSNPEVFYNIKNE